MSHHLIAFEDIHYAYPDGTEALRGVSFAVGHGGAIGLVGGNGAGKSTLLQHLNGSLFGQAGRVRIGDTVLTPATAPLARRAVGVVFQDPDDQLFMPTVAEDVAFGPLNMGLPPEQVEQRVRQALERVGSLHLASRPPYRLSAGEKRSVAIATVLAMEPDVLVMDEPSSHLDPRGRRRLIDLLRSFEHTKIIATHDLEMVLDVCDRVIILDAGTVVADGPVTSLLGDEALMLRHGLERPYSLRGDGEAVGG